MVIDTCSASSRRAPEAYAGRRIDARRDGPFFATLAVLWIASVWETVHLCVAMSGDGMPMPGGWTMSMMWMKMPGQSWPGAAGSFLFMWTVMMAAMMLPCLAPMLIDYRRSTDDAPRVGARTVGVGLGYFVFWALLGLIAYVAGVATACAQMRWTGLSIATPLATAAIVVLTGIVQLSSWKGRQLDHCRAGDRCHCPARGAFPHGLRLGVDCAACCLGYMLLLLVTDVMSLTIMAILTVAISAERLLPNPPLIARLAGVATTAAGVVMLVRAL